MAVSARLLPVGESAMLVEVAGLAEVLAVNAHFVRLRDSDVLWRHVIDVVPAARTVLLTLDPDVDAWRVTAAVRRALDDVEVRPDDGSGAVGSVIEIPVRYNGPDLHDVARHTGLSVAELIEAHQQSHWRVGFFGFAPGFGYLVGGDARLCVPRRAVPRTKVPAGSVALAGEFSAVYPRESPGGWQLIGRTRATLWDAAREPAALLRPGAQVRFVAEPERA